MTRAIVIALALALAGSAAAQPKRSPAVVARAKRLFQDGENAYNLGKFVRAAKLFEHAYSMSGEPALLFNVGQAYRHAGECAKARRAYESFLRTAQPSMRAQVKEAMASCVPAGA